VDENGAGSERDDARRIDWLGLHGREKAGERVDVQIEADGVAEEEGREQQRSGHRRLVPRRRR
jgi:hypothetical protein